MSDENIQKAAQEAVEEARMVLPGIQALFGFQLIAVFNNRFTQLSETHQSLHLTALVLTAVSIALIMTPAAYHRQVEPGAFSSFFVCLASRLVTAAMVPLTLALCLDIYIVGAMVLGNEEWAGALAAGLGVIFAGCWFAFPQGMLRRSRRPAP